MTVESNDTILDYPFSNPSALEAAPEWERLRTECPVARIRLPSGDEAVLLTRHEDVRAVLSDRRFQRQLGTSDAARISNEDEGGFLGGEVSIASGEGHERWRKLVGRYFTARRMIDMRPQIKATAEGFLDGMIKKGSPADLSAEFGFPLPVWVIGMLLGIPEADRNIFRRWSEIMLNVSRFSQDEIDSSQAEFMEYFTNHVAALRENPGDDLISSLLDVADSAEDDRISAFELVLTAQGLLIAGHETTSHMIGKMVAMLLADRARWERLLADRSLVRYAVEEALRFDVNPGIGIPRYITTDLELSGGTLPAGTSVICSMGAANRDGTVFADADAMNLNRAPNPHVSFGGGQYSCIGASLARAELQIALELLLDRLPTLELAIPVEQLRAREGLLLGGLEEVPVRW
ncbi:cytochrome P450 [Actinophytocola sp.]|uniref:cytochrome P450 n=1 Tax=Actinophytocola sp. TaxID=1872138 RepID=UPI002EDA4E08